jgi:hypothetical protein
MILFSDQKPLSVVMHSPFVHQLLKALNLSRPQSPVHIQRPTYQRDILQTRPKTTVMPSLRLFLSQPLSGPLMNDTVESSYAARMILLSCFLVLQQKGSEAILRLGRSIFTLRASIVSQGMMPERRRFGVGRRMKHCVVSGLKMEGILYSGLESIG